MSEAETTSITKVDGSQESSENNTSSSGQDNFHNNSNDSDEKDKNLDISKEAFNSTDESISINKTEEPKLFTDSLNDIESQDGNGDKPEEKDDVTIEKK